MEGADIHFRGHRLGSFNFDLDSTTIRHPIPFILPQPEVEKALETELRNRGVKVERGLEVVEINLVKDYVEVMLKNGRHVRARYVVGCDGAHSVVRKSQSEWKFEGNPINLLWAQCDGTLDDSQIRATRAAGFLGLMGIIA